jgi:inosine-uridine nucleoside N-ribohydrolase
MIRKTLLLSLAFAVVGCAAQSTPHPTPTPFTGEPRSVIIDTDMAADDWMAILYLLQRPDISVEAITVTGTGEAHCEPGIQHALQLAALAGHPEILVSCGRETPLEGDHTFPTAWRMNVDSLAGLTLPESSASPSSQSVVELFTSTIQSSPDNVTVLTLGPLTNLAEVLQVTPEVKDKIEMVYIMGGAVDVPGNVGNNHSTVEWNIYIDPHAASLVFQSGVPMTLIPLDATNHVPVTEDFVKRLKDNHGTHEATFVFDVLTQYRDFIRSGGYSFWDPLAAAILTDNSLATFETKPLSVIEEGDDSGRTQAGAGGALIRVAINADGERFQQLFLDTLNAPD